jgi:seryl-tRNA synthetase
MLSREFIRNNAELVKRAIAQRADQAPIDDLLELDSEQRALKAESERLKAERNRLSKSFGDKSLQAEDRDTLRRQAAELRDRTNELDRRIDELEVRLHELELWVPNIPDPSVPLGQTEEDNVVRWAWGSRATSPLSQRPTPISASSSGSLRPLVRSSWPGRASMPCGEWARAWNARWRRSCSTFTWASTALRSCMFPI